MPAIGRRALVLAFLLARSAAPAQAAPPAEGSCPPLARGTPEQVREDALPTFLKEGMLLSAADLLALSELLPEEVWQQRSVFFHEGMRMEIGACHRRYPLPSFFTQATERFAGKARLDENGNLTGHVAGNPFPPESIDAAAPDAGARWAWSFERRYRGAGPVGSFRIVDMPSRIGAPQTYRGNFFLVQTAHRADLGESDWTAQGGKGVAWVAGGRFDEPFDARHLAWRQLRPLSAETRYRQSDDTFVYVPTMRKPRRAATAWVDGVFTPRYRVSGDSGGGPVPIGGGGGFGPTESIQPTSALSSAASEHLRRGFTGLAIRPNAYVWKLIGERDVLAPLNASTPGYPENPDRNFGESGLSVASDRWDVRRAVVIEGVARPGADEVARLTLWIDWETQQPLYLMSRRANGLLLDVGILVHRFSGDLIDYPPWPDGSRALAFDPVAAVFFAAGEGGTGWRRESYDVRSVPVDAKELRRMTSVSELGKGR